MAELKLAVKVVPGASTDRIVGPLGDLLKIQVSAPPEKGKANAAVVAIVAKAFGVAPQVVSVVSGQSNPKKVLSIQLDDIDAGNEIIRRLFHGSV